MTLYVLQGAIAAGANLMPGTAGLGLAGGSTAQRQLGVPGMIRVNYTTGNLEWTIDGITYLPFGGGAANLGNFFFSGNTVTTTNANGNMIFTPNGTGQFIVNAPFFPGANFELNGQTFSSNASMNISAVGGVGITAAQFGLGSATALVFYNAANSQSITFSVPVLAGSTAYSWMPTDAAHANMPIVSNAAGVLSFGIASVFGGGTGIATTTAYGLITGGTTATGNFQNAGTGTAGQVYVSGGNASLGTWSTVPGVIYNNETVTPVTLIANETFQASTAGLLTFNMPANIAQGSIIDIIGSGAGGWLVQLQGGQTAHINSTATSAGGSLASTNQYNTIRIVCITTNTTFNVIPNGVITLA